MKEWGVIEGLKPYSQYKSAGLPWIDSVPAHWSMVPNRALMREQREIVGSKASTYKLLSLTLRGVIARDMENPKGKFPAEFNSYKVVRRNDFVFCFFDVDETPRAVGLSQMEGMITGAYDIYGTLPGVLPQFLNLYYLFVDNGKQMKPLYRGLRKTIPRNTFASLKSPLPPPDEQAAIVRFLDHANRKIDGFIRAKRKLIALLNEQKQAIIHRAVTRGLDPDVPLKLSGVDWVGSIPSSWETRRIKQVARILRGKFSHRPRNDSSLYDGPYPFLQTGSIARAQKFVTSYSQTLNEKGLAVSKLFPRGTLCMTIAANIGDVAILDFDACFPDSIVGFSPSKRIDRDYLYLAFKCMKQELLRDAPVNTQGNLNVERIGKTLIPLPDIDEQKAIVKQVEIDVLPTSSAVQRIEREVALMQEYRTRLTADIVTGKLDVRNAAASLPEIIDTAADETAIDETTEELELEDIE